MKVAERMTVISSGNFLFWAISKEGKQYIEDNREKLMKAWGSEFNDLLGRKLY